MAASRSTVGAIHFSLMFFVILTLTFGVAWYMTYGEYTAAVATAEEAKKDLQTANAQKGKYFDEIGRMKSAIGHDLAEIGDLNDPNANTVLGQFKNTLEREGAAKVGANAVETLKAMRSELDLVKAQKAQLEDTNRQISGDLQNTFNTRYQDQVDAAIDAQKAAEQARDQADRDRQEKVTQSDAELRQRRQEVNQLQIELDRLQEDFEVERRSLVGELTLLRNVNTQLRERLDEVQKISFEQPDGVIRKVDHTTGLVWINLGTSDDLPPRTTFSVYTKTHHGVGRGEDDIKGAIEVTRIIGPHLAEARILDEDYSTPIASNDPVYTPIWSPGRKHKFAVVGLIDIDGNDISDRQQFHEIVAAAGGDLDVEVDDQGNMTGDGLTVHHKFLVMGETPEPTLEIDPEKAEVFENIMQHRNDLVNEARLKGVRIVSLDLFLEWSGFRPQRRLWRPGDDVPWTLKGGGHATGIDEKATEFESAGSVSKVFGNKRRIRSQDSSSGTTSRAFGGNNYGN